MPEIKIVGAPILTGPFSGGVKYIEEQGWRPTVKVTRAGDRLLVRAELPGLTWNDVKVGFSGDLLEIENVTPRPNRNFYRAVPMPDGANPDCAVVQFAGSILSIAIPISEPR